MDNSKKYSVLYLVVLILSLVIMAIGITFTFFTLSGKEEADSTQIRTGTLYVNYVDGKTISLYDLFPIYEPTLDDNLFVYRKDFSVSSTGSLDQNIYIYINVTKNEFVNNDLMYALYDGSGNKLISSKLPTEGRIEIVSNVFLKSGGTNNYTALIWLNETGENQDNEQDCHFTGYFEIEAEQIKYK